MPSLKCWGRQGGALHLLPVLKMRMRDSYSSNPANVSGGWQALSRDPAAGVDGLASWADHLESVHCARWPFPSRGPSKKRCGRLGLARFATRALENLARVGWVDDAAIVAEVGAPRRLCGADPRRLLAIPARTRQAFSTVGRVVGAAAAQPHFRVRPFVGANAPARRPMCPRERRPDLALRR